MARRIEQIQRNRKNRRTKENILFEFEGKIKQKKYILEISKNEVIHII